jgi:rhomboid protease GluP
MPAPENSAPITTTLVILNVAVFLLEESWGGSNNTQTLARMGATFSGSPEVIRPATLFSYGYLHIGAFHLGINMFALWNIGRVLEPAMGKGRFFTLYSLSLLGGGVAIMLSPSAHLTAGASGALFGLLGAICMRMFARFRSTRDLEERREIRGSIGRMLIPNLVISFLPGVSLLGHAGGLGVGALFAALAWRGDPGDRPDRLMNLVASVLALASAAAIAWVWLALQPWKLG